VPIVVHNIYQVYFSKVVLIEQKSGLPKNP